MPPQDALIAKDQKAKTPAGFPAGASQIVANAATGRMILGLDRVVHLEISPESGSKPGLARLSAPL
jgi:hypothetical protein